MGHCDNIDFGGDDDVGWIYCPSFPATVLFAVLFFIVTAIHIFQAFYFRKPFCWVIIMGGLWEIAGFSLRALSYHRMRELGIFVGQQMFIILSPLWLNAFIYMVLGRMVHFYLPEKKIWRISARRLTLIFVLLDFTAFLVQGASSALMSSDDAKLAKTGINVYMGGIGLQELFILIFTGLGISFMRKRKELDIVQPMAHPWRPLLYAVFAGLFLITLRIIFRLIEYSAGYESKIAKSEAAFYVLDAAPMVIAMLLFNIFHPGRYLVGPDSEFPKKEKKKKKNKKSKSKEIEEEDQEGGFPAPYVNEVDEPHDPFNGNSRRHSRRSMRSPRSPGGGLMPGYRSDLESGRYQELESLPLHHNVHYQDRSASISPEPRPPYPSH